MCSIIIIEDYLMKTIYDGFSGSGLALVTKTCYSRRSIYKGFYISVKCVKMYCISNISYSMNAIKLNNEFCN
jgi:hypothetical protein